MGWPNQLEDRLMPYGDTATSPDSRPTVYVNVPAGVIYEVVASHGGIRSGRLPPMVEVDENGHEWAAAAEPPTESEEEEETESDEGEEEEAGALTSVIHMGAPPPPPPPLTEEMQTTGPLQPPAALLRAAMSPIERTYENFE